jgi:outer membrane beta-barrel protein
MTLTRNAIVRPVLLAAVLTAALLPSHATAARADAFEGKIQPISGKLFQKAGRLELTVGGGLSLNDAFFQKRLGDLKLGWHFTDALYLGVHGAFGFAVPTNSTTVCPTGQGCRPATDAELYQVPGRIRGMAGLEGAWTPIYGKLNTFSEKVAHIDLSLLAGADFIMHDQVLSTVAAEAGRVPDPLRTVGFHVGFGARLFLSEMLAIRFDLKDYVYGVTVPNGANGGRSADVQNQIFAELGVSVFFPFANRRLP